MKRKASGRKGRFRKGILCAAFGLGAIAPGLAAASASAQEAIPTAQRPAVLEIFDHDAQLSPRYMDAHFGPRWSSMLQRYYDLQNDPEAAPVFQQYLSKFDQYRNLSLEQKAAEVTRIVNRDIKYTGDANDGDYWQSGEETAALRKGDCEDYAILKYFVLRYLGVPEDKMYIATVNLEGGDDVNHAVLLLDVTRQPAPDAPAQVSGGPTYLILDNNTNKLNDTRSSQMTFFAARNELGFWDLSGGAPVLKGQKAFLATVQDKQEKGITVVRQAPPTA